MNQRPQTAMSNATTDSSAAAATASLVVKKSRTNPAVNKDAPKAPRVKKAPAVAAKNGSKASGTTRPQSRGSTALKAEGEGLDNITSGIKKITLVTKQQKQTRTRENKKTTDAKTAVSSTGPQTSNLPVMPGELQQGPFLHSDSKTVTGSGVPMPGPERGQPMLPTVEAADIKEDIVMVEIRDQVPVLEQIDSGFNEYQSEGPIPEPVRPQGSLQWLPVNLTEMPSPPEQSTPDAAPSSVPKDARPIMSPSPMKRNDLPVFTPTSQLRFAPRMGEPQQLSASAPTSPKAKPAAFRKLDKSMWEVPDSPDPLA